MAKKDMKKVIAGSNAADEKRVMEIILRGRELFSYKTRIYEGENRNCMPWREARDLVVTKEMKPADWQREFVTKDGNGIVLSSILGPGTPPIEINEINGEKKIGDGNQRVSSVTLYTTSYTKDELSSIGVLSNNNIQNTEPITLNIKEIESGTYMSYLENPEEDYAVLERVLGGRAFKDLSQTLQDFMLDNIYIDFTYRVVSEPVSQSIYVNQNKGATNLNKIETIRSIMKPWLWDAITKLAKDYIPNFKGKRFAPVKLMSELFCIWLNFASVDLRKIVDDRSNFSLSVHALAVNTLEREEMENYLKSFEKEFQEFSSAKANYFMLSGVRTGKGSGFDLRVLFYFYMNNSSMCTSSSNKVLAKVAAFLRNRNKMATICLDENVTNNYLHLVSNGMDHISATKKCSSILEKIVSDYEVEDFIMVSEPLTSTSISTVTTDPSNVIKEV